MRMHDKTEDGKNFDWTGSTVPGRKRRVCEILQCTLHFTTQKCRFKLISDLVAEDLRTPFALTDQNLLPETWLSPAYPGSFAPFRAPGLSP
ncbi:hypothetical protein TNCV_2285021 [Trichonephila clavipes]|nr:hypothetical protein TNCV_2285021 [Trichonephila clavipes]